MNLLVSKAHWFSCKDRCILNVRNLEKVRMKLGGAIGAMLFTGLCHGSPMLVLDVSSPESVEINGSQNVLRWHDVSGSGFDADPNNISPVFPDPVRLGNGHAGIGISQSQSGGFKLLNASQADELLDLSVTTNRPEGFSALMVVKLKSLPGSQAAIMGNTSNPAGGGFAIELAPSGLLTASLGGTSVSSSQGGGTLLKAGDTAAIAVVYNGESQMLSLYDSRNKQVKTLAVNRGDFGIGNDLYFGRATAAGVGVSAVVAEVQLFERPLSAAQLSEETLRLEEKWITGSLPIQHLSVENPGDLQTSGALTSWLDRSGRGNNASADSGSMTFPGSADPATGVQMLDARTGSESLSLFDAAGQDAWLDFSGSASGKSGFTVLLAFKPSEFVADWNDLLGNDSDFPRNGFVLRMSQLGQPVVSLGGTDLRANTNISPGETVFYAMRFDAAVGQYLFWNSKNGQTLSRSLAPGDFSGSMPVRLGRSDNLGRHFQGDFLETKIFDSKISDAQLEQEKAAMHAKWKPAVLPVEVLGAEGTTEERRFYLNAGQLAAAENLWFQVNSLTYQDKGSIRINDEPWLTLNHTTTEVQAQEMARGGMVHGGFNTIRFKAPASGLKKGLNRIRFRFNKSDSISIGYRVVRFNVLDVGGVKLLPASRFAEIDPESWQAPYSDQASIDEGERIWRGVSDLVTKIQGGRGRQLWNHYKADGTVGSWYGYDLPVRKPMQASCTDCHTQDGRDLEMFSYSNHSIIERSKFHNLTTLEGEKVASYIRSLSGKYANVDRAGRPWNPPYQPGPSVASRPIHQWAAGAGLDAVLDDDKNMAPYLLPNGMGKDKLDVLFNSDGNYDSTLLPLAIQFPDWKHWLPMVHPMDAFTGDTHTSGVPIYFDNNMPSNPRKALVDFRNYLLTIPSGSAAKEQFLLTRRAEYLQNLSYMTDHFRYFFAVGSPSNEHWRSENGSAQRALPGDLPREFAATSLSRLLAVRNFEFANEFDLQDKVHLFTDYDAIDHPQPRQWISSRFSVYTVGPHFQAAVEGVYKGQRIPANSRNFLGQSGATGTYESTNWYELQAVLNAGHGRTGGRADPVDYNYQHPLIMDAGNASGVLEPFRFMHTAARMYQTKLDSRSYAPDDGSGFLIRNMGPWYLFPNVGSSPLVMMEKFNETEPGLGTRMVNSHLRQFNAEMRKPGYEIQDWMRSTEHRRDEPDSQNISNVLDDPGTEAFWSWSSAFYEAIPYFVKIGTDPAELNSLLGWCRRAWPYISWETARNQWYASASNASSAAMRALDGDAATRWGTSTVQSPGQWFQLDLLTAQTFDQIVLDQGNAREDWPRGYQVQVSNDAVNWGNPVASGVGTAGLTTINFAPQSARYIRITQTGSHGLYWWSIQELGIYHAGAKLTPKAAPTGLLARSTHKHVDLTWQPLSGSGTYNIKRSITPGGPYTLIASNVLTTRYVDTGLNASTHYHYVVSKGNGTGESANSIELRVKTLNGSLNQAGWQASASTNTNNAGKALDGMISSRWSTNQTQRPGQWFQLDMITPRIFNRITLDQGSSTNDWPRGYEIHVSSDSVNWGNPVASGVGAVGLTTIDFPTQFARYIRITQTGSHGSYYWSIHEMYVFGENAPPLAPTGLTATLGIAQVMLNWTASSGATSYHVKRSTTSGGPYTTVSRVTGTSYADSKITNLATYYYVISAINSGGEGAITNQASITSGSNMNWTGAVSREWSVAGNWDVGVPGSRSTVGIRNGHSVTTSANAAPDLAQLTVNGGSTLNLSHSLGIIGTPFIDNPAPTPDVPPTGGLYVGGDGGQGNGTIKIGSGGVLSVTAGNLRLGNGGGSGGGSGTIDVGAGGSLLVSGAGTRIGHYATGTMTLADTGVISTNSEFIIGAEGGSNGTYTQTGGTLTHTSGDFRVGSFGGTGVYNISGGTANIANLRLNFAGSGSGIINQSGTSVVNHSGEFAVGWANSGNATYHMQGGTLNLVHRMRFGIGAALRTNLFNQTGGAVFANSRIDIGEDAGPTNIYDISGGSVALTGGDKRILVGAFSSSTGTLNVSGTALVDIGALEIGAIGTATGTANLNGGTLTLGAIYSGGSTAPAQYLNLNGSTLKAKQNANFISGSTLVVDLKAGGCTIDSNGFDLGVSNAIGGVGSLSKTGTGVLRLTGTNTYLGSTTVDGGVLEVTGSSIADGSTLSINGGKVRVTGVETVNTLFLDGVPQLAGTYGGIGSGAVNILPDSFDNGLPGNVVNVLSEVSNDLFEVSNDLFVGGYDSWAGGFGAGFNSSNNAANQDADLDGIENLLEYVLGGDPLVSDSSILPDQIPDPSNFIFTFTRSQYSETDVALTFEYGSNLVDWTPVAIGATSNLPVVSIAEGVDPAPDTVTITIPKGMNTELFGRLKAEK